MSATCPAAARNRGRQSPADTAFTSTRRAVRGSRHRLREIGVVSTSAKLCLKAGVQLALLTALALSACGGASTPDHLPASDSGRTLQLSETAQQFAISDGQTVVELDRSVWHARWRMANGHVLVDDTAATGKAMQTNPDYARFNDREDGIDKAYPGLPEVSYRPLAYRAAQQWHYATGVRAVSIDGNKAAVMVETDDGRGAMLNLEFAGDGALRLRFSPAAAAAAIDAVSTAWQSPATERYFGGGQRFSAFELRGTALPLWISHGPGSNREGSTNEIAAGFFWCPCGWGLAVDSDARGELVFARANERADAGRITLEDSALDLVYYRGTPAQILATHTARAGRPQWIPPDWMWQPMVWQDSDTSAESVRALVKGMKDRDIPLGAIWLDNPWDAGKGSFDFDPARFADPDALVAEIHAQQVRFMVWLSPFVSSAARDTAEANGWTVTGTRADGNDATYYPARSIDTHVDFTDPEAAAWWREGLRTLIRRGVDGVKVDRGEEDLSDDSVWHNGLPNRLNHNAYVERYHRTIFEAFEAERPDGDFAIFARGGWNGSARWAGHWAADNTSVLGELGLTQALRSLLSLSVSGFAYNGADIGGYAGLRQDLGESAGGIPLLPPGVPAYIRWTQLGALSPIMQTPVPPWWVNERAVRVYRRYATLHARLVPYIAAAAKRTIIEGLPIVQPLPFAYPDDDQAVASLDQYLFGPDLLVAPVTDLASGLEVTARRVYLPAGRWRDFWNGELIEGPQTRIQFVPLEQLPLYVRDGAALPPGLSAEELP